MSIGQVFEPSIPERQSSEPRVKSPWRLAMLLAIAAAASGILLTGVSVWFLGAVALAGTGPAALLFDFHTPAAFVRLFALSKTVGKYGERVVGHRAALLDQVGRRARLFVAMAQASSVRTLGWQLGNPDRLSDYMDDVEDIDYGRLRVVMPAIVLSMGTAALTGATGWRTPLALVPVALLAIAVLLAFRYVLPRVTAHWAGLRSSQRRAGQVLGAGLTSAVPLQAERAFADVLDLACASFHEAEANRLAQRRQLAMLELVAGLAGPLAALSILLVAWHDGSRGNALLVPAFVAFGWLALGDTMLSLPRIVLGQIRENAAGQSLKAWAATGGPVSPAQSSSLSLRQITLKNIPRQTPVGRYLGEPISLKLEIGSPILLAGASGTGKTSLLKQIAGWIGADNEGQFIGDGVVMLGSYRRQTSYLGLHDAAILSDTIRENLFAPHATDADCWQALAAVELIERVEMAGGLNTWITQDMLSLGEAQRINLARALLSRCPIVLLDEPIEHLDSDQAKRVLERVLYQLSNRVVVYSSHAGEVGAGSIRVSLD